MGLEVCRVLGRELWPLLAQFMRHSLNCLSPGGPLSLDIASQMTYRAKNVFDVIRRKNAFKISRNLFSASYVFDVFDVFKIKKIGQKLCSPSEI